jgi:Secretion system C-terminal sorting domain/Kelch motif
MKISLFISFVLIGLSGFSQGSWTQKSSLPGEGRHRGTGFSIGNKGYFGLGHYNSGPNGNVVKADIWEYDPGTDSWTQKADYGFGGTYGATAFTIGQYAYVGAHVYAGDQFYKFDPIANVWTLIATAPIGGSETSSFAIDEYGYVLHFNNVLRYDSNADSWLDLGPCPAGVSSWSTTFSIEDKGYVLTQGMLYEYKPFSNSWALRAPFPGEAQGGSASFSINGKGYVFGGYIQFLSPTSRQIWEFDPLTNSWSQHQDLPGASRRFSAGFSIANKGYIGTGTNGTNMKDLWEFDPLLSSVEENSYTSLEIYPNPTTNLVQVNIDEKLIGSAIITITDLAGKTVLQTAVTEVNTHLDLSQFNAGTYFCLISNSGGIISTEKIIKH